MFIGYSLDDPDFRQIWHIVSERLGRTRRMAYTIAVNARTADIARYERRGVKVINLPGSRDKYGEVLAATFKELREYMRDNVIAVSKVTEENPFGNCCCPGMQRLASVSFRSRWNFFRFTESGSSRLSRRPVLSLSPLTMWSLRETT